MKWKIIRHLLIGAGALAVLFVFCLLALWHWREARFVQELGATEAHWRAQGWPVSADELLGEPPPVSENAAPLWEEVAEQLRTWKAESTKAGSAPADQPPVHWNLSATVQAAPEAAERRELLRQMDGISVLPSTFALLEEILQRPVCHWERQTVSFVDFDIQGVSELLFLGQLLASRVVLTSWNGQWEECLWSLEVMRRLIQDLQEDPFLISWLVGVAVEQLLQEAWRGAVEAPGGLTRLLPGGTIPDRPDFAPQSDSRQTLVRALDGERIFFGQEIFRALRANKMTVPQFWQAVAGEASGEAVGYSADDLILGLGGWAYQWPARHFMDLDQRAFLAFHEKLRSELEHREMSALLEDAAEDQILAEIPSNAFLTRLAVPALGGVIRRLGVLETQRQISYLGQNILSYRETFGEWPGRLSDLVGEALLTDMFSGQPLVYRSTGEGFVLYSRGVNRQDNGGENTREDLLWRFGEMQELE